MLNNIEFNDKLVDKYLPKDGLPIIRVSGCDEFYLSTFGMDKIGTIKVVVPSIVFWEDTNSIKPLYFSSNFPYLLSSQLLFRLIFRRNISKT